MYIYIYIHVYIYVYIYVCIYIYRYVLVIRYVGFAMLGCTCVFAGRATRMALIFKFGGVR